ncbi:hypothetical protein [Brevibacillus laterosporus]|uniref:hypothetical protein n=1 Tax=Brevibacillus laterosporus TaxID=1465 RepID=UPI0003B1B861|nr:hypothetical protein [Brevibacillus laterosporus]ERM19681.1 hypothetical protein P615_10050 [Brevibacillus laterosporus PE36]
MNYHTIPSYEELFHGDTFNINLPIHVDLAVFALSFLGYLYTELKTMNKTLLEESLGIRGLDGVSIVSWTPLS